MGETGLILDAVLMLLLVAALGFGVRLEKKLSALRAGQAAFASAVGDLNQAAARAEAALGSLRAASQETDLLHDRITKARTLKAELEGLVERHGKTTIPPLQAEGGSRSEPGGVRAETSPTLSEASHRPSLPMKGRETTEQLFAPARAALAARDAEAITPVLQALAANQAAQQSLNRARRSLDEDLFAA